MWSNANIARYIQSLAIVMQESAEIGQMNSAVYADLFELLNELAGMLRDGLKATTE